MLEIKGLDKSFEDKQVLKDLDMHLDDGHVFGLVGVNGAGKSTLLRCIAGVYMWDDGVIDFDDVDVRDARCRRDILLIGDDPFFQRTSTIEDIISFYATFYDFDKEAYYRYLNMFKLDPKKPLNSFSKGMKRQVFLIVALAIRPRLLLLDEAFDGLDPLTRLDFKRALAELLNDDKVSVIISSHNLKELEDICDSFGLLEDGRIKTSGDLDISKAMVNRYQIAFDKEVTREDFNDLDVLNFASSGRIVTLVIKGDEDKVLEAIEAKDPLLVDVLPVDFEELFIYEVEMRGTIDE